jgi:hypothetical protein
MCPFLVFGFSVGGMNKSRQAPVQVKKVAPPIVPPSVPGLVSFSSFRVKKNQTASRDSSSTTLSVGSQSQSQSQQEKEQQRYSGSSLGSAGSSYTSSGSSSDNRSSIGTDDGYLLPTPNGYVLKGTWFLGSSQIPLALLFQ